MEIIPGLPEDHGETLPLDIARKALVFTADERRRMLRKIAECDLADLVDDSGEVDMKAIRRTGAGKLIKKLKVRRIDMNNGGSVMSMEIEIHDRIKAIEVDANLEAGVAEAQAAGARHALPAAAIMAALRHSPALRDGVRSLVESAEKEAIIVNV